MRAAWRLATSNLSERRSRTALLIAVVALSSALIAAVSCAMGSINAAIEGRLTETVGRAEARLKPKGRGRTIPESAGEVARGWPEVVSATPRLQSPMALRRERARWVADNAGGFKREVRTLASSAMGNGIEAEHELGLRPVRVVAGRLPAGPGEVVLDELLLKRLNEPPKQSLTSIVPSAMLAMGGTGDPERFGPARVEDEEEARRLTEATALGVGGEIEYVRTLRAPVKLKVVGIVAQPPLGGRAQAYMTRAALAELTGEQGRVTDIDLVLAEGVDPERFVAQRSAGLGAEVLLQTTEKVTSAVTGNMKANQLGLVLATVMAFLAASFIITTGMTTGVTERQRELAILRCIGAARAQLAQAQLLIGVLVGAAGALIGVPLGVGFAALLVWVFREQVPTGLQPVTLGLVLAVIGALAAGLAGAVWPAWEAARVSPLRALAARAEAPRARGMVKLLVIGLAGVALQAAIITIPQDGQVVFWSYATAGLPGMFIGYFLLSVPLVVLVTRVFAGPVSWVMRLPASLLARTVRATPYRHGFTGGAMMGGLALMVAIWTQGGAVLRDWLGKLEFPDVFVTGLNLTEESQAKLDAMPFVTGTCAITLHPVETDVFGVRALQRYKATFIAFEPERFFRMSRLTWVQGSPEEAIPKLQAGGAVLVAREFLVARGLGVGDTFRCSDQGKDFEFEIVGVVTSPGIEIASKFFNIGEEFTEQALGAVFGSRADLEARFGSDAIHLFQVGLDPKMDDQQAVEMIQRGLFDAGILDVGSGRFIKTFVGEFAGQALLLSSVVGIFAMLIACLGVANLIIAGIEARQFEFGVVRAIGGSRGMIARLVLAEAVLIAVTAAILGTLMGLQGALAGRRLDRLLLGIEVRFHPAVGAIIAGSVILLVITLLAAGPAVLGLMRKKPRELLGAVRG
ncbi:MAG: FtsX-like permease family protein [Phycisphaerales bacterium]|nr:FtsX-like permease family protein [Phycisphaerales bacterium]